MSSEEFSKRHPPLGLHYQLNLCTLGSSGCPYNCSGSEKKKNKCKKCFLDFLRGEKEQKTSYNVGQQSRDKIKNALRGFTPIPLTLRTNDGIELPSEIEVKLDHQTLSDYLQSYGFAERIVMGDGNCQYRALSDQLYETEDHYDHVKRKAIKQLKKESQDYSEFIRRDKYPTFDHYVDYMSGDGVWGDNCTLKAAADAFGATIYVFSIHYRDKVIPILPSSKSTRDCYISRWAGLHYNSVYYKFD